MKREEPTETEAEAETGAKKREEAEKREEGAIRPILVSKYKMLLVYPVFVMYGIGII